MRLHVYRATDAMLRTCCAHFNATPDTRDWGSHVRELRRVLKANNPPLPNVRTVELIDAIRAVDRNPLMHPEDDLDTDEALAAFNMCQVAVMFMVQQMKKGPDS